MCVCACVCVCVRACASQARCSCLSSRRVGRVLPVLRGYQVTMWWTKHCATRDPLEPSASASALHSMAARYNTPSKPILETLEQRVLFKDAAGTVFVQSVSEEWSGQSFPTLLCFSLKLRSIQTKNRHI